MSSQKDSFIRNGPEDSKFRRNNKPYCAAVYNHAQHIVKESMREVNGLTVDLYRPSEYDRLALSLISPLPNEQDFAINVCMLLSGDIKHVLKLDKHPRILHYLLAHAAVFHEKGLKDLFSELYGRDRGHSVTHFWKDVVFNKELHRLADDNYFNEVPGDSLELNSSNRNNNDWYFDSADPGLFCLGRTLGTQDFIGQRVTQVANILRNLSVFEDNSTIMAKDVTFIRFALLCCSASWNDLPRAGWEMLANIAEHISADSPLVDDILMITTKGLLSDDRSEILGSLNTINAIARSDNNEQLLLTALTPEIYERVCSLLSLHDIMMLIDTLECLYSLTSMGEKACNCIVKVRGAIDILVSLITVEAQSYGPKACIQMRVVETVDNNTIRRDITPIVTASPNNRTQTTHIAVRPTPSTATTVPRPAPAQLITTISPQQSTIATTHHVINTTVTLPTSNTTTNQACQVGGPQQAQVQKAPTVPSTPPPSNTRLLAKENEQFALGWLRSTLEAQRGARIEEAELYKLYINWCAGVGRQGVIAPAHFPRCVRSVFGLNVGPKTITTETGNLHCYEGICMKNKIGSTIPSPILKAQLCSPLSPTVPGHIEPNKVTQRQAQARKLQNVPHPTNQIKQPTVITSTENKPHSVIMETKFSNSNCRINGMRNDVPDKINDIKQEEIVKPPPLTPLSQKMNVAQAGIQAQLNHLHSPCEGANDEGASNSSTVSSTISKGAEGDISTDSSESSAAGLVEGGVQTNIIGNNTFTNKIPISPKGMKLAELLEKGTDKRDDHLLSPFNGPIRLIEKGIVKSAQNREITTVVRPPLQQPPGQQIQLPQQSISTLTQTVVQNHLKRPTPPVSSLDSNSDQPQNKKPCLNGDINMDDKHKEHTGVSPNAASLYANLAADILQGETLDEPVNAGQTQTNTVPETPPVQHPPRINEQITPNIQQTATVAAHNLHPNRQQILLVGGQQYMVAQPHPALVQHTGQAVFVTQQQAGAKAIFFLRPQPQGAAVVVAGSPSAASQTKVSPMQRIRGKSPPPPLVKLAPSTTNQATIVNKSVVMPAVAHSAACQANVATGSTSQGTSTIHTRIVVPKVETSTSTTTCPPPSPVKVQEVDRGHFLCEWRGCMRSFKSGNELYIHSCETHCPRGNEEVQCLWERCDNIKRKRFSLMTHLYDRHCNAEVIKMRRMLLAELVKKDTGTSTISATTTQQVTVVPRPPTSSTGVQTTGSPVLQHQTPTIATTSQQSTHIARAINRRAVDFINAKELQEDNEGPITKSIRLTAALVLRNVVVYSTYGRRYLTRYEPHLASVGLSNVESSRTIAHVLYDMSQSRCDSGPTP